MAKLRPIYVPLKVKALYAFAWIFYLPSIYCIRDSNGKHSSDQNTYALIEYDEYFPHIFSYLDNSIYSTAAIQNAKRLNASEYADQVRARILFFIIVFKFIDNSRSSLIFQTLELMPI